MSKNGEFELNSGRRVNLQELRQYMTYEGLLAGLPTTERNRQRIEHLTEYRDHPYANPPYIIEPIETPIELPQDRQYPFGTPSALPAVTCVARFKSIPSTRNKNSDYSELVIIWFQGDFAFPIDPNAVAKLLSIDWDAYAADIEY